MYVYIHIDLDIHIDVDIDADRDMGINNTKINIHMCTYIYRRIRGPSIDPSRALIF